MKEKNNKGIIGIAITCIIILILLGIFGGKKIIDITSKKQNDNISENDYYNDYKYKILYKVGSDTHEIYLLSNDEIKPLLVTKEYESCEGEKCLKPTGKNLYEEVKINLSEENKKEVLNLFTKLSKNSQNKIIDTTKMKLETNEIRILDALITDNEDLINLSDEFVFDKETKTVKDETGKTTFVNSKTFLKNSDNKIVNKIANYLNKIVDNEFKDINEMAEESLYSSDEVLGVNIETKLALDNIFYISLTITIEGNMGGVNWYQEKGYVFNAINGDIIEFSKGWKDKYYEEALKEFKTQELYSILENEGFEPNWKEILKTKMFETGSWYLDGENIVFLIPGTEIGFDEATCKVLKLKVKDKDWVI